MLFAVASLAALAIILAWPAPIVLSRARWARDNPGVALILWQAIAVGGGLSMITSLVGIAILPVHGDLLVAVKALFPTLWSGPIPPEFALVNLFALSMAALLLVHLLLNVVLTAIHTERERRRLRDLITVLSKPGRDGTRVLGHDLPVAYCLPGVRTLTVLSEGMVELLSPQQLDAVLEHERTHLRQHHHLVLLAFRAWKNALPWFPIANRAETAVAVLVEYLADDAARALYGADVLEETITRVGGAWDAPDPAGGRRTSAAADGAMHEQRVARLGGPPRQLPVVSRILLLVLSAALVAVPAFFVVAFIL